MTKKHKILLLDDDQDILDLYKEMLTSLPSEPEVQTANSGARAIAFLEAETFNLLISDLKMPKMDGLQLLTIVRKRWPTMRTVVMSALNDEQFKQRAYSMGIDQFLEKPRTGKEINYFCECIESLLTKEETSEGAFRGVQSKSLMDIIQLECLSQSSSTLKITSGPLEGKIWIDTGEVIDAAANDTTGEEAFRLIASWKGGAFEMLPPEAGRRRTIHNSYHALLLETAQAMDEAQSNEANAFASSMPTSAPEAPSATAPEPRATTPTPPPAPVPSGGTVFRTKSEVAPAKDKQPESQDSKLFDASRVPGIEFIVAVNRSKPRPPAAWGLENPEQMGDWANGSVASFRTLGEKLQWGGLKTIEGRGLHGNIALITHEDTALCAGWERSLAWPQIREGMKKILTRWIS
jgi:CheY-like chemotaxis protein